MVSWAKHLVLLVTATKQPPPSVLMFKQSGSPRMPGLACLAYTKARIAYNSSFPQLSTKGGKERKLTVRKGCLVFCRTRLSVTVWATSSCGQTAQVSDRDT